MKRVFKSLILAVMLLLSITLVACDKGEETPKVTDQEVVDAAKGTLSITYTEVTTNFTLPTTAVGGVTVSWASNDAAIVISGQNAQVTRPTFEEGNKSVVLTATLSKGTASASKEFTVVVVCLEDVQAINAITVAEAIETAQDEVVTVRGIVSGFHYGLYQEELSIQACYITDGTGTIYVYGYLFAQEVAKGDDVVVSAKLGNYKGYVQLTEPTLVQKVSSENAIPTEGAVTDKTVADIAGDLSTNYTAAAYVFEGVQIKKITGSSYVSYAVEDKNGNAVNIYSSANGAEFGWLEEYLGKELNILFAVNGQNSAGTKWRGHVLDILEVVGDWGGGALPTGTKETIANLLSAAADLEHDTKLEGTYETTGVVASISDAYNSEYKNITFILSDGTNTIECYRAKGDEAANVAVGDTVTVVGEVKKYYEKIEFDKPTITARTAGSGEVEPVEAITVAEAIATAQGTSVTVKGIVSGFHCSLYNNALSIQACYITDETGTVYVYGYQFAQSVAKGDEVVITATVGNYKDYLQLTSPTLVQKVASGKDIPIEGAVTDKTVADIAGDLSTNYTAAAYIFDGVQISKTVETNYVSYVIVDAEDNVINIYSGASGADLAWLDEYVGQELKVLFAVNGQNSDGTKWRGHVLAILEVNGEAPDPDPEPDPNETITATVSEVLTATISLAEGATSTNTFITTGVVTGISEAYNEQYSNVSFYLSDGTKEILVYHATGTEAANLAKNDTVTVEGKVKNYYGTFEFVEVAITARTPGEPVVEETPAAVISFADVANRTTFTSSQQVWAQNGVTVTNDKASSTSAVADYSNPARFYKSSNLLIEYSEEITKIEIVTSGGKCYAGTETIAGATLTVSAGVMTIVLDTPATSFSLETLVTQIRVSEIRIFTGE